MNTSHVTKPIHIMTINGIYIFIYIIVFYVIYIYNYIFIYTYIYIKLQLQNILYRRNDLTSTNTIVVN